MPAVLLTLLARTQTLLVENNPGGELLRLDPYAGLIANTAAGAAAPPAGAAPSEGLYAKWRRYGPREFVRRAAARAARAAGRRPRAAAPALPDRRAHAWRSCAPWAGCCATSSARRRSAPRSRRAGGVSDREIFARFPLYLVPTYPGDAELFASPGFRAWLPRDLPLVEKRLDEIMSVD